MTENDKQEVLLSTQKDNLNTQTERTEPDTAGAEKIKAGSIGKFASVEALYSAYTSLEAEFTRRSQRLKELEEGNKAMPEEGAPSRGSTTDDGELLKKALSNESVKRAVIGEYLKTVATNKSVPLIAGGVSSPAPRLAPKSVKEAGALAEKFLKN
ncbi:MAG: hypothetical protein HDQ88_02125 [Clostridia bacterium]|nr:hypothetical protein [Clostridia bacterium]